jgi:hypothetical protein
MKTTEENLLNRTSLVRTINSHKSGTENSELMLFEKNSAKAKAVG